MKSNKICIIDDNEAVCQSLKFLFDSFYDIDVTTYYNPLSFLEAFSPAWQGCLLIDLFMPSLSGIDLMRELKKRNCNMNIIVISGHGAADVATQAMAAGAQAFISKPFEVENLLEKVNSVLEMCP